MPVLVSASQLSKSFGAHPLFQEITFALESGERVGLIGPNGAGKSTLLKIIASRISADAGQLSLGKSLRVGYLEQVPSLESARTIAESIAESCADAEDWERESLVDEWISKLSLNQFGRGRDTRISDLSGGWRKRVALARELAKNPDLLLLDEPTNHLDIETILWLENFLARAPFAQLIISHDRVFLEKTTNRILELDRRNPNGLLSVNGGYSRYLLVKDELLQRQESQETRLRNTLKRETEWLRQGAKARTTKQQARVQRAGTLADEVEDLSYRNQKHTLDIRIDHEARSPKKLVELRAVKKSYGDRVVLDGVDLMLTAGRKVGFLGANGSGKTTLIKTLLGELKPDAGSVALSELLQPAYFDQKRENLDPTLTVLRTLCPTGETVEFLGTRLHVRSYMSRFLFSQAQMDMSVDKLSGGEQNRLLLAKLFLRPINLLVLDEPTNDLDLPTLTVLEDLLSEFKGALVLVAHDRYFLDQVCDTIYGFVGGRITPFSSLAQWEEWFLERQKAGRAGEKAVVAKTGVVSAGSAPGGGKKKLSYKDQREYDGIEARISALEAQIQALESRIQDPKLASNAAELGQLTGEMTQLQSEVERLYARWDELEKFLQA